MPGEAVCSTALRWSVQSKISQLKAPPLTKFFEEGSVCSGSRLSSQRPEAITEPAFLARAQPELKRGPCSWSQVTAQSVTRPRHVLLSGEVLRSPLGREVSKVGALTLHSRQPVTLGCGLRERQRRGGGRGERVKGDRSSCSCLGSRTSQMTIGISIRTP